MLNIKKLLTKMLNALPRYKRIINAQSFNTTTANVWQYTGKSFTIPTNHVYIARLYTQYANGKPIGLGFHTASSFAGANTAPIYNIENSLGVSGLTTILEPGTYYVWSKRGGTGNNTYTVTAFDCNIS